MLNTVEQVSRQLYHARTLRRERSSLFTSSEKKMFDESFTHTDHALRRVAAHAERARVDMQVSGGKVRANTRMLFVLRDSPNIHVSLTRLGIASQSLNGIFATLLSRGERSRDSVGSNSSLGSPGNSRSPPTYEESQFLYEGRRRNLQRRASAMSLPGNHGTTRGMLSPTLSGASPPPSIRSQPSLSSLSPDSPQLASTEPSCQPSHMSYSRVSSASPHLRSKASISQVSAASSLPEPPGSSSRTPSVSTQFPLPAGTAIGSRPLPNVAPSAVRKPFSFASVVPAENLSGLAISHLDGDHHTADLITIPTLTLTEESHTTRSSNNLQESPSFEHSDTGAKYMFPYFDIDQDDLPPPSQSVASYAELPVSRYDAYRPGRSVLHAPVHIKSSPMVPLPENMAELPVSQYDAYNPGRAQPSALAEQPTATLKTTYIPDISEFTVSKYRAYCPEKPTSSTSINLAEMKPTFPVKVDNPVPRTVPCIQASDRRSPVSFTPDNRPTSMPIPLTPGHAASSIPMPIIPDHSATSMPISTPVQPIRSRTGRDRSMRWLDSRID